MPNYKYKAMNKKGDRIEGTYDAESRDEVINMISANNYYPLNVEEVKEGTKIEINFFNRVKIKDISIFCRQFYTMLNAGVSVNACLNILANQLENKKLKEAVTKVEEQVKKGETLSESMREQKGIFPPLLVNMVETGEFSGNLDSVLLRMSTHFEKETKINNKIKAAMMYPAVVSVVAITVLFALLIFVMPTFIDMFKQNGVTLPLITRMVLGLSTGLTKYGIFIAIAIGGIIFGIRYYLKTEGGQLKASKLKLSLPVLKGLNQKIITSRFTRTLSTLLASGVSLIQALEVISSVVGNKVAEEALVRVKENVIKGDGLAKSIEETKLFPAMLTSMIMIGEESGALDDILNKTADFYDEELEAAIQAATGLLEPLLIVIMGICMGVGIISIMMPMFNMYSNM